MIGRDDLRGMEICFLDEIAETLGDETPVLIYADWLAEQDDAASRSRGEFIRLQSILRRGKPGAQRADMEWQARDLWWANVEQWLGPLYEAVDSFQYERGFLRIEVSLAGLAGLEVDDLPAWDWVRRIAIRKGGFETMELLSNLPRPRYLAGLEIGRRTITDAAEELPLLLGMPLLQDLHELDLAENQLSEVGCVQLARWPALATVRRLVLRSNEITSVGLRSLLGSPYLTALEELDLAHNFVEADGARELRATETVPRLRRIDLSHNQLNWHDVAALQKRFGDGVQAYLGWSRHGFIDAE